MTTLDTRPDTAPATTEAARTAPRRHAPNPHRWTALLFLAATLASFTGVVWCMRTDQPVMPAFVLFLVFALAAGVQTGRYNRFDRALTGELVSK